MLSNVFSLLAACALVNAEESYVVLPINRVPINGNSTHPVTKNARVDVNPEVLYNNFFRYTTFITLGSRNQFQEVAIDTGSSDLWVYGAGSDAKFTFDPSNSQYVNDGFNITYADGSGASGNYYKDEIYWYSTTIELQFGVAQSYNSNKPNSLSTFGIGYESDEASKYGTYPNFPVALKNAGKIQSTAYSLYLNDVHADFGSLVFGAVDTSRYTGTLKLLPVTSKTKFNVDFEVFNSEQNGLLDSGSSVTTLPDLLVYQIARSFGATYDVDAKAYKAPDTIPTEGLTYTFGGVPITVPASELWAQYFSNSNQYYLTILPYSQAKYTVILGDSFLRSAYVVYDIESNQIAIAQANWNPGPSNYEVITSSGIPGAQ